MESKKGINVYFIMELPLISQSLKVTDRDKPIGSKREKHRKTHGTFWEGCQRQACGGWRSWEENRRDSQQGGSLCGFCDSRGLYFILKI